MPDFEFGQNARFPDRLIRASPSKSPVRMTGPEVFIWNNPPALQQFALHQSLEIPLKREIGVWQCRWRKSASDDAELSEFPASNENMIQNFVILVENLTTAAQRGVGASGINRAFWGPVSLELLGFG